MCSSPSFGKDSSMEQVKLKRSLGFSFFLFLDIILLKRWLLSSIYNIF